MCSWRLSAASFVSNAFIHFASAAKPILLLNGKVYDTAIFEPKTQAEELTVPL